MPLKFLGRGSGFSDEHTSAYFSTENKEMVIIDCPVSAFQKLKHLNLSDYEKIYVLITHTHGDHVGGLGLLVQYAFFVLKKTITIVAPSIDVAVNIKALLFLEGNEDSWYAFTTVHTLKAEWFGKAILTEHSPQLKGKCFGYQLTIDGKNIIYTGDTSTIMPFVNYLTPDSLFYVDTSVHYGMIHLNLENVLNFFIALTKKGIKVYLMHLDDVDAVEKIVADYSDINVVTLD